MHAQRVERDLAGDHELVVALVVGERRGFERDRGQQLGVGLGHPARRVGDPLVGQVVLRQPQLLQPCQGGSRLRSDGLLNQGD